MKCQTCPVAGWCVGNLAPSICDSVRLETPPDGRLRVGIWCPCMVMGGAEAWQLALVRSVDPARVAWQGVAVTQGEPSTDPRAVEQHRQLLPVSFGREAATALAGQCDVIISWAIDDIPGLTATLPRKPLIVSVCHAPAESPWGRTVYSKSDGIDRFVAVSELAMEVISPKVRSRTKAVTIWNAVDEPRMIPRRSPLAVRRSWGIPDGDHVAGYLGRLSLEKRPHLMLDLAQHLPDDWHVVIVGDGADSPDLERVKRDRNLSRVHLVGADPDAGDVLRAFDTLIVPSEYESFGLTIAEGLWVGTPVISTPVGLAKMQPGLTRLVPSNPTGEDLAHAIRADVVDPDRTQYRVKLARSFAHNRLSLDHFGRQWTDYLCGLTPRPGLDPATRDAILACPDRGSVLPVSRQAEGCGCGELSECRAGKGKRPGAVTLAECIACKGYPHQ